MAALLWHFTLIRADSSVSAHCCTQLQGVLSRLSVVLLRSLQLASCIVQAYNDDDDENSLSHTGRCTQTQYDSPNTHHNRMITCKKLLLVLVLLLLILRPDQDVCSPAAAGWLRLHAAGWRCSTRLGKLNASHSPTCAGVGVRVVGSSSSSSTNRSSTLR